MSCIQESCSILFGGIVFIEVNVYMALLVHLCVLVLALLLPGIIVLLRTSPSPTQGGDPGQVQAGPKIDPEGQ